MSLNVIIWLQLFKHIYLNAIYNLSLEYTYIYFYWYLQWKYWIKLLNKSVFSCIFFSSLQSTNKVFKIKTEKKQKFYGRWNDICANFMLIIDMNLFFISFAKCYDRRKANINQKIKIIACVCYANNKILSLKWLLRYEFC